MVFHVMTFAYLVFFVILKNIVNLCLLYEIDYVNVL